MQSLHLQISKKLKERVLDMKKNLAKLLAVLMLIQGISVSAAPAMNVEVESADETVADVSANENKAALSADDFAASEYDYTSESWFAYEAAKEAYEADDSDANFAALEQAYDNLEALELIKVSSDVKFGTDAENNSTISYANAINGHVPAMTTESGTSRTKLTNPYGGYDLGGPVVIKKVKYYYQANYSGMQNYYIGLAFDGANTVSGDDKSGGDWETIVSVTTAPASYSSDTTTQSDELTVSGTTPYRYVRYNSTGSRGYAQNGGFISEVEFYANKADTTLLASTIAEAQASEYASLLETEIAAAQAILNATETTPAYSQVAINDAIKALDKALKEIPVLGATEYDYTSESWFAYEAAKEAYEADDSDANFAALEQAYDNLEALELIKVSSDVKFGTDATVNSTISYANAINGHIPEKANESGTSRTKLTNPYGGYDLGEPVVIKKVKYYYQANWNGMPKYYVGLAFDGANTVSGDDKSGGDWETIVSVTTAPAEYTSDTTPLSDELIVTGTTPYRYVRYNSTGSSGYAQNEGYICEVEFYANKADTTLLATTIAEAQASEYASLLGTEIAAAQAVLNATETTPAYSQVAINDAIKALNAAMENPSVFKSYQGKNSVNYSNPERTGIRFMADVHSKVRDDNATVTVGFIITRQVLLENKGISNNSFTHATDVVSVEGVNIEKIDGVENLKKIFAINDNNTYAITAVLYGMDSTSKQQLTDALVVRPFYTTNGTDYVYGNAMTRSVCEVAESVVTSEAGLADYNDYPAFKEYIDNVLTVCGRTDLIPKA